MWDKYGNYAERVKIMKKIAIITLCILFLFLLPGCIDKKGPSPDTPVTLNMWHVYGSQTTSPLNDAIDEFNKSVGMENGIVINVVSVTSSSAIDKALESSAKGEPGANELPDLFTAYPRVAEIVGKDKLLAWDDYFTKNELAAFNKEFISEGYFDNRLLMLPIAKSTEAFYINKTLFNRFSEKTGTDYSSLSEFDGIFETAKLYYDTTGSDFMQINDHYHYFLLGMKSYGEELITDGKLNCESSSFEELWKKLAGCAIYGGLCLEDGYAAARWKTAEVISNIGSTADILYQPKMVFYPDNTSEAIESVALPYPSFGTPEKYTVYRGGGLFALESPDEKKNRAAYIFAEWLTEKSNNLEFVTKAGYLPVTDAALEGIFETDYTDASYKNLYETVNIMTDSHKFIPIPLFDKASELQHDFEKNIKFVLKSARNNYAERVAAGEDKDAVMDELISSSLSQFKVLCAY